MAEPQTNDDGTNDDAGAPDLEALVAAAVEKAKAPLDAKNRKLLAELKEAKARAAAFGELDPEEVRDQLDALEDIKAGGGQKADGTETAVQAAVAAAQRKAERERKRMEQELTEARSALDSARTEGRNFLLNSALDSAISAARIAEPFRPAVKALQRDSVAALLDDEPEATPAVVQRIAQETVASFAASDVGKHYVQAPVTNGGGARGSAHSARGGVAGAKPVHTMTELEKVQFVEEHGHDAYVKLLDSAPRPSAPNGSA